MAGVPLAALTRVALKTLPPLSLYVHVPWCIRKCPYCDFNSHAVREPAESVKPVQIHRAAEAGDAANTTHAPGLPPELEARYIAALTRDLDASLAQVWGRRVYSIFFGGGTPSLLSAAGMDQLLANIRARLTLDPEAEITLEANPGTFEAEKFRGFRAAGVNRLSIGIQSFNDAHLHALGRVHSAAEARRAIDIALTHFDNVNLDVMYALPQQTLEECAADVEVALSFGVPHLSLYHLTLEPNTLFHRYPPALPDDDQAADMQDLIEDRLTAAGYEHYETSAWCKPGRGSKHNLNYWRFGDYLGIGAGAHGKISFPDRVLRDIRYKQPLQYIEQAEAGDAVHERREVSRKELPFEFMLNALRLREGFALELFEARTGLDRASILRKLEEAASAGYVERDGDVLRPTEKGRLFQNDLLERFLP